MAVVSTAADRGAPVRGEADRVFEVPGFLDGDAIVAAAAGWDAGLLHPGYGFLSESASFAAVVEAAGIAFVGSYRGEHAPPRRQGGGPPDRRGGRSSGIAFARGGRTRRPSRTRRTACGTGRGGVPVRGEGGGRGRRHRHSGGAASGTAAPRRSRWPPPRPEAAFGDDRVYVERWLDRPRHVEIQVLGDGRGAGIHLGERECSVQRRRQKLLEWAPGFGISADLRARMGEAALRLVIASGYRGAGTVEFLLEQDRTFHFLEVNTRLQVEHPVTEEIYGVDLVDAQLEIATGVWPAALPRPVSRAESFEPLSPCGAAFEARIVAESPQNGFAPSPGRIRRYREPEGGRRAGRFRGGRGQPGAPRLRLAAGEGHRVRRVARRRCGAARVRARRRP